MKTCPLHKLQVQAQPAPNVPTHAHVHAGCSNSHHVSTPAGAHPWNCCDVVRSALGMVRSEMVSLQLPEVAAVDVCTRVTSAARGVEGAGGGWQPCYSKCMLTLVICSPPHPPTRHTNNRFHLQA